MLEIDDPDARQTFSIVIHPGTNYDHYGMTIVPLQNFNGLLHVPISISDSIASSDIQTIGSNPTQIFTSRLDPQK
jgi:hypothetical protein